MPFQPTIQILPSHRIDVSRWDQCITESRFPVIYSLSLYLNHMADQWDGIIVNDYEMVMAVPWRKKMGIRYCYQVPFIQQLGWFYRDGLTIPPSLKDSLFRCCSYGDYAFNHRDGDPGIPHQLCHNFILDLGQSYPAIAGNYARDFRNNLRKSKKEELHYTETHPAEAIQLYRLLYQSRLPSVRDSDYRHFEALCKELGNSNRVIARKVTGRGPETYATALLLKDEKRMYHLMNSTTVSGRNAEANYFLLDGLFREFALSGLIFDFEGSDEAGIQKFYLKSGAVNQPYASIHYNHLPFPLNRLKR